LKSTLHALLLASLAASSAFADDPAAPESETRAAETFTAEITVTATRSPVALGESGRSVEVLTAEEIARQPVQSLPELLQLLPGFDIRRRGPFGVQADLSARGSSFEEVLVLIDGAPMHNPQTGHHNADLALPLPAIERVEVLYGPGSSLYGSNASGGVIQLFTQRDGGSAVHADVLAGEHSLSGGRLGGSLSSRAGWRGGVELERLESAGHRTGAEFDQSSVFARLGRGELSLVAGFDERDFGAYQFYSTRFPDELERTAGGFATLAHQVQLASGSLRSRGTYRRHRDYFILDRARPSFSQNFHHDEGLDAEVSYRRGGESLDLEIGVGARSERLESSNLGWRERDRLNQFTALAWVRPRFSMRGALHIEQMEGQQAASYDDTRLDPSLQASVALGPGHLRASAASAYRLPSMTELYYNDPTTAGNVGLEPERSWTYEVGYDWVSSRSRASATAFRRDGKDLIDFVQFPGEIRFRAVNLRAVETDGLELVAARRFAAGSPTAATTVTASYTALDASGAAPAGVSRYVFDYLRHRAQLRADGALPWGLSWGATTSWNERQARDPYWRVDARLSKQLGDFAIYVDASNLTDERYVEQGAVEMPGRWISGGVRWRRSTRGAR
jgi:vitamin B12 transporter